MPSPAREDVVGTGRRRRPVFLLAALLLTAGGLGLALFLGSWGFDTRRYAEHQGRLRRVLVQQPSMERVVRGLADEGTPLIAAPRTPQETARVIAELGGTSAEDLRAKARRHPRLRVFHAADMLYFIYFDDDGIMRDFACVSR